VHPTQLRPTRRSARRQGVLPAWIGGLAPAAVLWVFLWCAINSGPWNLRLDHTGTWDLIHAGRAALPLLAMFFAGATALQRFDRLGWRVTGPGRLWALYGVVTLLAATMADEPLSAAYWSVAYLASLLVLALCVRRADPLGDLERLNQFNWVIATGMIITLVFIARDELFVGRGYDMTAYGVVSRVGEVAGMAMSRSSGMARFSAIPGIAAFVLMWQARGLRKLLWAAVVVASGALIYLMQSRGAIVGFAFAITFVTMFLSRKTRLVGVLVAILLVVALVADMIPEDVTRHLLRDQEADQLGTLTGRTRAWSLAWPHVMESPIWGWGMQADRALIHEHVHNTYLYALLSGGVLGGGAFTIGLIWAWVLFWRIIRSRLSAPPARRTILLQAGGILAFFTIRSIPEVCGAMFGVDLMAMAPILAYLAVFDRMVTRSKKNSSKSRRLDPRTIHEPANNKR